jgi:large subunit ribosomal protein L10
MGRTLESKKEIVAGLEASLSGSQMLVAINYKGLSVAEITDLRNRLRPANAECTVTKNTLMKRVVSANEEWKAMESICKDASAYIFLKGDVGAALKAYQDFQKATKKTEIRGGVMEGKLLSEEQVKAIADLPSKEQLMAQIAGALNAVTAKIAIGVKEVPNSLARAIKAVSEKE